MSRFQKLSHVIWHCQHHVVWVPKYRYRVLRGPVAEEVFQCIQVLMHSQKRFRPQIVIRSFHALLYMILEIYAFRDFNGGP